jgi:hypothetical protein
MKNFIIYILLSLIIFSTQAQTKKFKINFDIGYQQQKLQLDTVQYLLANKKGSVAFNNFKFYVSNICLLYNGKKVYAEKNSYHLVDISNVKSLAFSLNIPSTLHFNNMQYNLGIDSTTNSKGVLGKDLDPTKGMYWAWHSGYINFKLEGKSNVCKTRNNVFQFHLGGYQYPYNSSQIINLKLKNKNKATIQFDIYKFIEAINLATTNEIMTPSKVAVELSKNAALMFGICN